MLGLLPFVGHLAVALFPVRLLSISLPITPFFLEPLFEVSILGCVVGCSVHLVSLALVLADSVYCLVGLCVEVLESLPEIKELRPVHSIRCLVVPTHFEVELLFATPVLIFLEASHVAVRVHFDLIIIFFIFFFIVLVRVLNISCIFVFI